MGLLRWCLPCQHNNLVLFMKSSLGQQLPMLDRAKYLEMLVLYNKILVFCNHFTQNQNTPYFMHVRKPHTSPESRGSSYRSRPTRTSVLWPGSTGAQVLVVEAGYQLASHPDPSNLPKTMHWPAAFVKLLSMFPVSIPARWSTHQ